MIGQVLRNLTSRAGQLQPLAVARVANAATPRAPKQPTCHRAGFTLRHFSTGLKCPNVAPLRLVDSSPFSVGNRDACSLLERITRNVDLTALPRRAITRVSRNKGRMKTARMVTQRFRRLGNGMWLRRQAGHTRKLYRRYLHPDGKGINKVHKKRRHVLCNLEQSRLLDKMVSKHWRKQKWYVKDPYRGYTDETLFYYRPGELAWNEPLYRDPHRFEYGWRRAARGDRQRRERRTAHGEKDRGGKFNRKWSHRAKPIPDAANMRFVSCPT